MPAKRDEVLYPGVDLGVYESKGTSLFLKPSSLIARGGRPRWLVICSVAAGERMAAHAQVFSPLLWC